MLKQIVAALFIATVKHAKHAAGAKQVGKTAPPKGTGQAATAPATR